jgi:hypothetical protein
MRSLFETGASTSTEYRIRVGDEEIELAVGVTLIGRDSSCRITIFDSMISRRHARIQCDGAQAAIEDLGSRNGTRVNGVLISGPHNLRAGDRVGIGSHELLVKVVDRANGHWGADEPTGILNLCPGCRLSYPSGPDACPRCGVSTLEPTPDRKRPDPNETKRERWSLGMLIEMVGKAILTERATDAERIMREAAIIVSERLRESKPIADEELEALCEAAAWVDKAQSATSWSRWVAGVRTQISGRAPEPT